MRIGIDIDGVLNSQYNFCIDYGTKFCIYNWDDCKKDYVIKVLMNETIKNIRKHI